MALPTTNLTAHFDGSTTTNLFKTFVSGGPHTGVPIDGDTIAVWKDANISNQIFKQDGSTSLPLWRSTTPLMLLSCLDFTTGQYLKLANDSNVNKALSDIITNSAYTTLVSFYAETITNSGNSYQSPALVADVGGYWGAMLSLISGVPNVLAYGYDGAQKYVRIPCSAGASHVFMMRHESGTLYASLDGGAESSVACGNTASLTGLPLAAGSSISGGILDGRIGEIAIYNAALTGTNLTDAISYFTTKWITGVVVSGERTQFQIMMP